MKGGFKRIHTHKIQSRQYMQTASRSTKFIYQKGKVMLRKKALWGFVPVLMAGLLFLGGCHKPSPEKIADRIIDELGAKLDLTSMAFPSARRRQLKTKPCSY